MFGSKPSTLSLGEEMVKLIPDECSIVFGLSPGTSETVVREEKELPPRPEKALPPLPEKALPPRPKKLYKALKPRKTKMTRRIRGIEEELRTDWYIKKRSCLVQ
jgi:hypothetical protein